MNTYRKEILEQIQEADMLLIGIGEEFDNIKSLRNIEGYNECRTKLEETNKEWLLPALNMVYGENENSAIYDVLSKLSELIKDKNYFVISTSTNETVRKVEWREKRLVMPCGGSLMKQCKENCGQEPNELIASDWQVITKYIDCVGSKKTGADEAVDLGTCPKCGSEMVPNSIYTEKYDENGYLEQWQFYTKWLQGTLNRKLLILELGVGMQCPSVIRWPFEKIAFFNQKASFVRVNEKLYQLSEELGGKGISISMNAIDWLGIL